MKIAVAGTGYVGLSIATLLAQHNKVTAVDISSEMIRIAKSKFDDDRVAFFCSDQVQEAPPLTMMV